MSAGRILDYLDLSRVDGKTLKCKGGNKQCGNRCVPSTAKCANEQPTHKGLQKVFGNKDDWAANPDMPIFYKSYKPSSLARRGAAGLAIGAAATGVAMGVNAAANAIDKKRRGM